MQNAENRMMMLMVLATATALVYFPGPSAERLIHPTFLAMVSALLIQLMSLWSWKSGKQWIETERRLLSLFLLLMPTVYLASLGRQWLHGADIAPRDLWTELGGQVIFATLALPGLLRRPSFNRWLAIGIAMHGLVWDGWHIVEPRAFMPHWYAPACLFIDVGWAGYVWYRFRASPLR